MAALTRRNGASRGTLTATSPSFERLYRLHAGSAFRRAERILGNAADAHEIVHDVFLSLLEEPAQYAQRAALTTFLYSAVTHACLNHLRNQRNRRRLLQEHGSAVSPAACTSPALAEHHVELRRLLARIPEPLGHVAIYRHFDALSHRDIARVMGCSSRHVGNLLERLTQWLEQPESVACMS